MQNGVGRFCQNTTVVVSYLLRWLWPKHVVIVNPINTILRQLCFDGPTVPHFEIFEILSPNLSSHLHRTFCNSTSELSTVVQTSYIFAKSGEARLLVEIIYSFFSQLFVELSGNFLYCYSTSCTRVLRYSSFSPGHFFKVLGIEDDPLPAHPGHPSLLFVFIDSLFSWKEELITPI